MSPAISVLRLMHRLKRLQVCLSSNVVCPGICCAMLLLESILKSLRLLFYIIGSSSRLLSIETIGNREIGLYNLTTLGFAT